MLISLDFDEVLFPMLAPFLAWYKAKHFAGLKLEPKHVENYDIKRFLRSRTTELIEEFYTSTELANTQPEVGAVDGVNALLADGHTLIVVTGRPTLAAKQTERQLKMHFRPLPVHYTNFGYEDVKRVTKQSVCRELGVKLHVDDRVHDVNAIIKYGVKCIWFRKPWQFTMPADREAVAVWNWDEIVAAIKKLPPH